MFQSNTEYGKTKYGFLHEVVKSCLTLQNGNASAERSLSDNKNTLTSERVKLNDETLMALRISKEYARSCQGAHNADTFAKEDMIGIKLAHEMVKSAKRNFTNAKAHSNEQKKLRLNIGLKRKSEIQRLINSFKKLK